MRSSSGLWALIRILRVTKRAPYFLEVAANEEVGEAAGPERSDRSGDAIVPRGGFLPRIGPFRGPLPAWGTPIEECWRGAKTGPAESATCRARRCSAWIFWPQESECSVLSRRLVCRHAHEPRTLDPLLRHPGRPGLDAQRGRHAERRADLVRLVARLELRARLRRAFEDTAEPGPHARVR